LKIAFLFLISNKNLFVWLHNAPHALHRQEIQVPSLPDSNLRPVLHPMSADEAQRVDSARVRGLGGFHLRHLTNSTDVELSSNNRKKLEEAQTGGCKNTVYP